MLLSELPFELLGSGAPGAATGISINGVDLANMYAPASAGVASGVVTGFSVTGVDLGTLFAGAGTTAALNNSWASQYTDTEYGASVVTATVALTFNVDGTVDTPYGQLRWLAPNLNGADYEVVAVAASGTFTQNDMVAYAQLNVSRTIRKTISAGPTQEFREGTVSGTVTIRRIAEPAVLTTGSILFIVNAESYGTEAPP